MMVLRVKNSNYIKCDGAGFKRVVCTKFIEPGICKTKIERKLDSNARQLINKPRLWFY